MLDTPSADRNPPGVTALVARYQQHRDERSIAALLRQYDRFLQAEAGRGSTKYGVDRDDARQVANLAFVHAVGKYDRAHGSSLMTYSRLWVRSRVSRMVAARDVVDIPVSWLVQRYSIRKAIRELKAEGIPEPTPEQIGPRCPGPMSPEQVERLLAPTYAVTSLDRCIGEVGSRTVGEMIADDEDRRPDVATEGKLTATTARAAINEALSTLPEREAKIAMWRFIEDLTLQEVGNRLGLTRERIRQIEGKVIDKLRMALAGDERVAEALAG